MFFPFGRFRANYLRGDVAFRELIPLRGAVESIDTYSDMAARRVEVFPDMFVKLSAGATAGCAIAICYLRNIQEEMADDHSDPPDDTGIP